MKKHLVAVISVIGSMTMGSDVAQARGSADTVSFRVAKGDTYTNLFGPDWQKAYQQSKVTVIRNRKPVFSPDILIEGAIIAVSADVRLTPRASARIAALDQQRKELKARLMALSPRLESIPAAQQDAAQCRRILGNDLRFPADVDFAAREIDHLERLAQRQPVPATPLPQPAPVRTWWMGIAAIGVVMFAIAFLWQRNRPIYPDGIARYRDARADVRDAFRVTNL